MMANARPARESSPLRDWAIVVLIFGILAVLLWWALTFEDCLHVDDSFENTRVVEWYYDGNLEVTLVPTATHGAQAARLGQPIEPTPRSQVEYALLYRTMVITDYGRPVLTFWYRMFVNDIMHYSDFRAYLLSSDGASGAGIKRDGYRPCEYPPRAPPAGYDLGWRTASYDLSRFKGQTVTLVFSNTNLHAGHSLGIWTCVDHVEVAEGTPLSTPRPHLTYLPVTMHSPCDAVLTETGVEVLPTRPPTPEPP